MTIELPCALAGCPAGKRVIIGLTIYYFIIFFVLACWFTYMWAIIQDAISQGVAAHLAETASIKAAATQTATQAAQGQAEQPETLDLMKNVVGTVGTDHPLIAKVVTIGKKPVIVIPDSLAVPAVMASGAFGGLIHAIRSTYFHVIDGDFGQADAIKMFLRPFSGSILALLFYMVLRAGLGDATNSADAGAGIIFYVAVGGIVGMFTDQTVSKLKKIAEAILTKPEAEQEKQAEGGQS
ncbi:hypothetical protein [Pseudodesulfovibrio karagichevae]|uniref:Uncharacterized protein n=1 Tax=Pseudodesulfovibrio karagichevae TaxID=3239305 RepID=A0ABV4K6C3_9BACT